MINQAEYIEWLNEVGVPEDDKKSNGGRIPDDHSYGLWLKHNDPVAFNVGFQEYKRERQGHI